MAYLSKAANYLLYTPFDTKAVVPEEVSEELTSNEFFNGDCYVHPGFENKPDYLQNQSEMEDLDFETFLDELNDQLYRQKRDQSNFMTWLNNMENFKVHTINGNAGTGKTTYINYLKFRKTDKEWIVLDISKASSNIPWFGDARTLLYNFHFAYMKVYASILIEIRDRLFCRNNDSYKTFVDAIYYRLKNNVLNYDTYFRDLYPAGHIFYDELTRIMGEEKQHDYIVKKAAKHFESFFGKLKRNPQVLVSNALDILLLVVRCADCTTVNKTKVIVFDSFERFVSKDEIYNKEVDDIRKALASYNMSINVENGCHINIFKFIMAIRNSTSRKCGGRLQTADELASNLDVSTWFNSDDVLSNKMKWYESKGIGCGSFENLERIIGDMRIYRDGKVTGLKLLIDSLFNDNKRLIIDFIGTLLEKPSNQKLIKIYERLWEKDNDSSRFAARSIIRGLIFKELGKTDNLFKELKTYTDNHDQTGLGDTRKILTIMFNHLNNDNQTEMKLTEVLQELCGVNDIMQDWSSEVMKMKRKSIAKILFYLSSYNRRDNDWVQFIDLQVHEADRNIRIEKEEDLEDLLSSDIEQFTITIMPSGIAYLKYVVASFEFFSLRYCDNYKPLFACVPTVDEMEECSVIEKLQCYKTISRVFKKTEDCIKCMSREGDIKIYFNDSTIGKTHKERIILQHKSYLDNFVKYIQQQYIELPDINEEIREKYSKLQEMVKNVREQYNNI